jgi:hypothetical protein
MSEHDFEGDENDGVLFRFWIRAGSYPGGFPGETMAAILHCKTPADYRRALTDLATLKGVNFPDARKGA